MWGINLPVNTWFTGEWYKLETDEDLILENPDDYDEYNYEVIPIEFEYKQYTDNKGIVHDIKGLDGGKAVYTIEINGDITGFKIKDRIKLMGMDITLRVTNVQHPSQTYKSMAVKVLPGLYDEYVNRIVLTLE